MSALVTLVVLVALAMLNAAVVGLVLALLHSPRNPWEPEQEPLRWEELRTWGEQDERASAAWVDHPHNVWCHGCYRAKIRFDPFVEVQLCKGCEKDYQFREQAA